MKKQLIIGLLALGALRTQAQTYNTATGQLALRSNTSGHSNTANGFAALEFNTTGFENTAIGRAALYLNDGGDANTAAGVAALYTNNSGDFNTANGYYALYSNSIGSHNTANGSRALYYTTGNYNTANGSYALYYNSSGGFNTATGYRALYYSTGNKNTSTGGYALCNNTTGNNNSADGYYALYDNKGGSNNVALGHNTGRGIINGSNNTIIGANVSGLPPDLSNTVILADGSGNQRLYIDNSGKVRIGDMTMTTPGSYKLYVSEGIMTEKVKAVLKTSANWADHVFAEDYQLKPLAEVEAFVKEHQHLPGVPSAEQLVKEGGIDMNQMFAKQMEKIEELTLYLIEVKKENGAMHQRLERLERLEQENEALKMMIHPIQKK